MPTKHSIAVTPKATLSEDALRAAADLACAAPFGCDYAELTAYGYPLTVKSPTARHAVRSRSPKKFARAFHQTTVGGRSYETA
jgi:hypothetical protein